MDFDLEAVSWPRVIAETIAILALILVYQQYQRGEFTVSIAIIATVGAFVVILLRELFFSSD